MAHHASVSQQALHVRVIKADDLLGFKAGECAAKIFTLVEDGEPAQTRLKAFEAAFFEQPALVGDRKALFGIVVTAVVGGGFTPPAAVDLGCVGEKACGGQCDFCGRGRGVWNW